MILSDLEIKSALKTGNIVIEDYVESRVNPNSYNLTLMDKLRVYDNEDGIIDMRKENKFKEITIPEEGYVLIPGRLYIGSTNEVVGVFNDLLARVEGRSSIGRLGICIHLTAGFIDTGFKGKITLEISCVEPVRIYPNTEFCQIAFEKVYGLVEKPYSGKYQGQSKPVMSRMYKDLKCPIENFKDKKKKKKYEEKDTCCKKDKDDSCLSKRPKFHDPSYISKVREIRRSLKDKIIFILIGIEPKGDFIKALNYLYLNNKLDEYLDKYDLAGLNHIFDILRYEAKMIHYNDTKALTYINSHKDIFPIKFE